MRVINLLQRPTSGTVTVSGQNLQELNDKKLRKVRKKIGMIFQQFNLLQSRTVLNNVEYPLLSEKTPHAKRKAKAQRLLDLVGLADYAASYPEDLSGGQKQRVAIARALANDPDILISDEATSALDPQTTDSILQLLQKLNEKFGLTVVLITHEMEVIKSICQEMAVMEDGRIIERGPVGQVFAQPKQSLTQTFIESAANVTQMRQQVVDDDLLANLTAGERLLYLQFSSQVTDESVITELTAKFGIKANILFANVQKVAQLSLGYMLVILSEKDGKVEPGITYLKNVGVTVTDLAVQERSPENAS